MVHCRRLVGFTGYFNLLSTSRVDASNITTRNITISKTNDTNGNITIEGNITANGDINVKNGKILNNSGSIESHTIRGDEVRGRKVEVPSDGTLNVNGKSTFNGNATFKGDFNMPILGQDPEDLRQFLIQVNNRLNALESKK